MFAGKLDKATLEHMKKPRCGRPDFEGPSKSSRHKRYSIPYGECLYDFNVELILETFQSKFKNVTSTFTKSACLSSFSENISCDKSDGYLYKTHMLFFIFLGSLDVFPNR